jgi:YD repeat-containing protein
MYTDNQIPEPFLFNPLKHHLGFIREFIFIEADESNTDFKDCIKRLRHLGTSVMDVYTGGLSIRDNCSEVEEFLEKRSLLKRDSYSVWAGKKPDDFRIITLSDGSQWTLKYHDNENRFVHFFPARNSQHTFRVKASTLKSAILYNIKTGKDFITADDLNRIRELLGLSPVKDPLDTEAITEMIEILRVSE